jgi:hypothetical protein
MENEDNNKWIREYWRPAMAFVYMGIVIFDFVIAPIGWSILQYYALTNGNVGMQWMPLTLSAGGLFHAAMGAILGVSAFTRGMEKVKTIEYSNVPVEHNVMNREHDHISVPGAEQPNTARKSDEDFDFDM